MCPIVDAIAFDTVRKEYFLKGSLCASLIYILFTLMDLLMNSLSAGDRALPRLGNEGVVGFLCRF
jgi:hypothetical protein